MVIPSPCSAFSLPNTQAYLKESFLISAASFSNFFFGSFVDPTTFVDQMASGGRLALIYVSGDNNIDMNHFLSHFGLDLVVILVIWW